MATTVPLNCKYESVIGCDPGPTHCALASLEFKDGKAEITGLAYVPNTAIHKADDPISLWREAEPLTGTMFAYPDCFVFEKCGSQGVAPGALTFETCMMAGELRHIYYGTCDILAFTPGDWRYVVTGKAGANDAIIRNILLDILPEHDILVKSSSKKARQMYKFTKPITSHLRDAIGTALAVGMVSYRKGLEASMFKGVPE